VVLAKRQRYLPSLIFASPKRAPARWGWCRPKALIRGDAASQHLRADGSHPVADLLAHDEQAVNRVLSLAGTRSVWLGVPASAPPIVRHVSSHFR
jgi:hypothetical protein